VATSPDSPAQRLILLGSTGSIGRSTLEVVAHLNALGRHRFEVVGLAAGNNAEVVAEQASRFRVAHVAIASARSRPDLDASTRLYAGPEAACELIDAIARPGDIVLGAMVGYAGLAPTMRAISRGCHIALANKETLVAAGSLVMPAARAGRIHLLPVDSEHSGVFQCLMAAQGGREVERVVLTASGGPFRTWPRERLVDATLEEALKHPTWAMGPKVTIDSASLMNKALEIIEAHWLFDLPGERVEAIVHPQSLVHAFVEFVDGSVVAQLSPPDMKTPIQYALTWPRRDAGCSKRMPWDLLSRLDFEPVDHDRFPAMRLAYDVIARGGTAGACFNAANEAAVEAFTARRIRFGAISELVGETLAAHRPRPVHTLQDVATADAEAREHVRSLLSRRAVVA
jgi:1-deoxy-D-xylulose-5-phosphate reductoisomerase